ncbi:phage tail length tape measure family protein [Chitinasiproducens palmae]|uniref:Phage tail tape measure protein, lambda family n=1 Tax=Chitinasiproducens palmae TaxID=1770053 RepID=A0A1H2PT52_9BURK|nr:phage tail length tape measure family protein [Chitinasiproducens palmae]SDV49824.1 phage tail tape measure protein, lambda family [Chitinasiproducens palmae]
MASNQTVVSITADASGFEAGITRAQRSARAFAESVEAQSRRVRAAQDANAESVQNGANASVRSVNSFINCLSRQSEAAGKSRAELLRMQAAALGVSNAAEPMIAKIEAAAKATDRAGEAAHSFSLKSAGARRELLVLGHEAATGSWSNFGGSLLVLGERTDALSKLMSPLGVALGAAGAAAYAFFHMVQQGAEQFEAFEKSVKSTHGYLGVTADDMVAMSNGLQTTKTSLSTARETMAALASTGAFTGDQLRAATQAAIGMSEDTGVSAEDAVKSLSKIRDNVISWMTEYQSAHHAFTAAQVEEVQKLVDTGDTAAATAAVIRGLNAAHDEVAAHAVDRTGVIAKAWRLLVADIQDTVNHIMNIGVPEGNLEKMVRQTAELNAANARFQNASKAGSLSGAGVNLAALKADVDYRKQQLDATRQLFDQEQKATKARAASTKAGDAELRVKAYVGDKRYATPGERHQLDLDDEAKRFTAATKDIDQQSAKYQEALRRHQSNVKQIEDTYAKSQHKSGGENGINADIAGLQGQLRQREDALKSSLDHIKSLQAQGVIDAKTALQQEHDARQAAYQAELKLVSAQEELAGGKKQKAAAERYRGERERLQQKILDNDRKFADDSAALQRKETADVDAYREALDKLLNARRDASQSQLSDMGLGTTDSQALARLEAVSKEYANRYLKLISDRTKDPAHASTYDAQLQELNAYQQQRVALELSANAQIRDAQSDYALGATKAVADYVDAASNRYAQMSSAVTSWTSGMEDAIVQFATTGKVSFSSLATSIIADLVRMQVKASAVSFLSSAGSGIASVIASLSGGMSSSSAASLANVIGGSDTLGTQLTLMGEGKADGGIIRGAGTGRSDSILARLSNGEFVVNAAATARNRGLLESVNNGASVNSLARFADGGYVGGAAAAAVTPGGGAPIINIENHDSSDVSIQASAQRGSNGQWLINQVVKLTRAEVARGIASGSGPEHAAIVGRFGVRARGGAIA